MTTPDLGADVRPVQQPRAAAAPAAPAARRPGRPATRIVAAEPRMQVHPALRPWWFSIPKVLMACFKVVTAPLMLVVLLSELVMAGLVLGVVGLIGAWWLGWIGDAQIMAVAKPLGDRLMAMIQSLGYL